MDTVSRPFPPFFIALVGDPYIDFSFLLFLLLPRPRSQPKVSRESAQLREGGGGGGGGSVGRFDQEEARRRKSLTGRERLDQKGARLGARLDHLERQGIE